MADGPLYYDDIEPLYLEAETALDAVMAKVGPLREEIEAVERLLANLPALYDRTAPIPNEKWVRSKSQTLRKEADDLAWAATHLYISMLFKYWTENPHLEEAFKTYENKQKYVTMWNERMRDAGAAFENPETKEPCLLVAAPSRNEEGRFTLQGRISKTRSGSYKTVFELAPLKIVRDVPRKEGFVEKRKREEEAKEKGEQE